MKKVIASMSLIVLIFSMIFALSACKTAVSQGNLFDRSKITIQKEKQAKVGDISWNLLDIQDLGTQITSEAGVIYPATQGKFIFISFSVENTGPETRTLYDLRVIDDSGRFYSICNQAYGYMAPAYSACTLVDILPNLKAQNYSATFDIDKDSKGLILEFTDLSLPAKDVAYIDLGF